MGELWPSVSIIVPAYNAEKTIERCLESLTHLRYLGEYEVILVNNKSTDNTLHLAKKHKVKIINAFDFQTSYYARNAGLACCSSQIAAFTDSDCVADENWIHYLVQKMLQNPQVAGVGGKIVHLERNALETIFGSKLGIKSEINGDNSYLVTANAAYWVKAIKEVGYFDSTCFSGGDVGLSWKILKKGYQIAIEPKAVIYHFPRETPYSFLKQSYTYGSGHAKLFREHQTEQSSEPNSHKSESRMLQDFLSEIAKGGLKKKEINSINNPKDTNSSITMSIMTSFFDTISTFIFVIGIIQGFKKDSKKRNPQIKKG